MSFEKANVQARILELELDNARHQRQVPPPCYDETCSENATFTNEFANETASGTFASVRSFQSSITLPPYPESWNSLDAGNDAYSYWLTVLRSTQDKLETTQRQLQIQT